MATTRNSFLSASSIHRSTGALYPDPWGTMSSVSDPTTITHLMRMAERLLRHNPILSRAYERVIAFLVTKVTVQDCSDEEREKYIDYLYGKVGIISVLQAAAYDYVSTGNSFCTMQAPFTRYLMCSACRVVQAPIDKVDYEFRDFRFFAKCPHCRRNAEWKRYEVYNHNQNRLKVRRWSPHDIEIKHIETTDDRIYYWKPNEAVKQAIRRGDKDYLRVTPWVEIECVRTSSWLMFNENKMMHLYKSPPAGWRTGGWGIPDCLHLKPLLYQLQYCMRHNEGLIHESVIPIKVISPQPTAKLGMPGTPNLNDPSFATSMGPQFVGFISQMLSARRADPHGIVVSPYSFNYQQLGGDIKQLIPKDIMDQNTDMLLNAAGIPVDFYKATFSTQVAPMALRTVQSSWTALTDSLNRLLQFIMEQTSKILQIEPAKAELAKPIDTDDINRTMARLNLMQGQMVSPETGLESIGLDAKEEMKRMTSYQVQQAKEQKRMQEEMDREGVTDMLNQGMAPPAPGQQQQGAPAPGGTQGAQGGQAQPQQGMPPPITNDPKLPRTPQDQVAIAQAWASWLLPISETNKQAYQQYLQDIRQKDPVLHTLLMAMMEKMRTSAGRQAVQQQLAAGQPIG